MYYDVFNGDADGICALHQLRLTEPRPEAETVSGVKRDIRLLHKIRDVHDGDITVLDISMKNNLEDLQQLLNQNCRVFYVDHHFSGTLPDSPALTSHIDPDPETCTSLIVDRLLAGKYRPWAVVGAYGDNLHKAAARAAADLSLSDDTLGLLRELGELLNYNGYGLSLADLHFPPQRLYEAVKPYTDPLEFYNRSEVLSRLRNGFQEDMHRARSASPFKESQVGRIFKLPAEPWARRVAGVFSNEKAREMPDLAHALLIENQDTTFRISVRAPLNNRTNADTLCLAFPTGGGRAAAAGINELPPDRLADFLQSFEQVFNS
jgi:hypothetical protein